MNVYDFDNTIYDGESVFDFYLYSVRRQPKLIRYLFVVVKAFLKYKFCRITTEASEWNTPPRQRPLPEPGCLPPDSVPARRLRLP